jgi:ribosomal-protein-alanine N-acetyltransferase
MPKLQKTPQIQKISPRDHNQVVELIKLQPDFSGFNWSPEKIKNELNEAEAWGLWVDNDLASFITFRESADAFEISALATSPKFQRQGAMRSLLEAVINAKGQKAWWLEVHEENQPALLLYKTMGFKEDGRRPRYYPDGGGAVLMSYGKKV